MIVPIIFLLFTFWPRPDIECHDVPALEIVVQEYEQISPPKSPKIEKYTEEQEQMDMFMQLNE